MPLPKTKTPPCIDLSRIKALVYGLPKIGKSTFCAGFPEAVFLATERGLDALDVYQQPITKWSELIAAVDELEAGKHAFKTVVIDTIDNAFKMCVDHFNAKHKVEYIGDLQFGKGYGLVTSEFHRVLTRLSHLPYGLLLVSHAATKDVETATGTVPVTAPTIPDRGRLTVLGLVDLVLYADQEEVGEPGKKTTRRVIRTKRTPSYEAGDRTGRLPKTLPLEFASFAEAFLAGGKETEDAKTTKTNTSTKPAQTAQAS